MQTLHQKNKQFGKPMVIINQEGATAIVLAILLLVTLTIIGVSSINSSNTELNIIRNEQIREQNFYQAEAGSMDAAQRIDELDSLINYDNLMPGSSLVWMDQGTLADDSFFNDSSNWDSDNLPAGPTNNDNSETSVDNTYRYAADYQGKQAGSSLKKGALSVNRYAIYGLANNNGGEIIINIGLKKPVRNP